MSSVRVLIKFISPAAAGNVISGSVLEPELLIFAGYGIFLSDTMRNRYNYFFHRRKMRTIVTDPLCLEEGKPEDILRRLTELIGRYAPDEPVIDITDADAVQGFAVGTILHAHPEWNCPVLNFRTDRGACIPVLNGSRYRLITMPDVTAGEMHYLRYGTPDFDRPGEIALTRQGLDRPAIKMIRGALRLYEERSSYWSGISEAFRKSPVAREPGRSEYTVDAKQLGVRDEALEDLVDDFILFSCERRGGIRVLRFPNRFASELLLHLEQAPLCGAFLTAAYMRETNGSAAYRDLILHGHRYVSGIRRSYPFMMTVLTDSMTAEELRDIIHESSMEYEDPVRRILIRAPGAEMTDEIRQTAEEYGMEVIPAAGVSRALQPR